MFDNYKKMLDELGANTDAIFSKVAKKGAIKFRDEAVRITDLEGLFDTGYYSENWNAKAGKTGDNIHEIVAVNTAEYASHLEYGHKLRNSKMWKGKFVGRQALDETDFYCIEQLDDEYEKEYKKAQRKYNK